MRSSLGLYWLAILAALLLCSGIANGAGASPVAVLVDSDLDSISTDAFVTPGVIWSRSYDNGWGEDVARVSDGFVVVGSTVPGDLPSDVYLLRVDESGRRVWNRTIGGPGEDKGYALLVDDDYAIAGSTRSFTIPGDTVPRQEVFIVKTYENGTLTGFQHFGPAGHVASGYAIAPYMDSGYLIAGTATQDTKSRIYLVMENHFGSIMYDQTIGVGDFNTGLAALRVRDGFLVTGACEDGRLALLKTDLTGGIQWLRVYRNVRGAGQAIALVSGGYVIVGHEYNFTDSNLLLLKVDDNGTLQWKRSFGGPGFEYGMDVMNMPEGIIVAGYTIQDSDTDAYLVKTDQDGDLLGEWVIGSEANVTIRAITASNDWNVVLAGYLQNGTQAPKVYLLKVNLSELERVPDQSGMMRSTFSPGSLLAGQGGDLSGDGKVNSLDALLALIMAVNNTSTDQSANADARDILRYSAGSGLSRGDSQAGKPVAAFNVSSGEKLREVVFDATLSSGAGLSYAWSFGDRGTGTGMLTSHTYASAGSYNVTLKVTDSYGRSGSLKKSLKVSDGSDDLGSLHVVAASFSFDKPGPGEHGNVVLNGSASLGNDLTYAWDLDDGTTAAGVMVVHMFAVPGGYNVRLTVSEPGGLSDSVTRRLDLGAGPAEGLVAVPWGAPAEGTVPLTVKFNGYNSTGPYRIMSYGWDFGDGASGSGMTPIHEYTAAGKYLVNLTVSDDHGLWNTQGMVIAVYPPSPTIGPLTATRTLSPVTPTKGRALATPTKTPVFTDVTPTPTPKPANNKPPMALFNYTYRKPVLNLTAAKSYDSDGTISKYEWSMKNAKTGAVTDLGTGAAVKKTMTQTGTYLVTLKVTDDDKASDTFNETITIMAV